MKKYLIGFCVTAIMMGAFLMSGCTENMKLADLTPTNSTTISTTTTTPPTTTTIIYSSGTTTIGGSTTFDFDEGVSNPADSSTEDVWWQIIDLVPLDASLNRRNNALLYRAGAIDFDSVTYQVLSTAAYTSESISSTDLADNTVVYVQTPDGRYTKFKVLSLGYNLDIQWVTYQ